MLAVIAVAAIAALVIAYLVTRPRTRDVDELAASMAAHRARQRADMEARAARIVNLAARGDIEDADIAASDLLLDLIGRDPPAGADVAAVRALSAMTAAYVERDAGDAIDRTLDALEANRDRLGKDAIRLALTRLDAIAASLAARGRTAQAERARAVRDALATRFPGSAT